MKNLFIASMLMIFSGTAQAFTMPNIVECRHVGAQDINGVVYGPLTKIFKLRCNCPPEGQGKCTVKPYP